jgi:hypothetical protein
MFMVGVNRWDEKAGLLYLLCFEHVDNFGAYRIPSETGLLIPSDYNNYFRFARYRFGLSVLPVCGAARAYRLRVRITVSS